MTSVAAEEEEVDILIGVSGHEKRSPDALTSINFVPS
jgi:hypothetical protein